MNVWVFFGKTRRRVAAGEAVDGCDLRVASDKSDAAGLLLRRNGLPLRLVGGSVAALLGFGQGCSLGAGRLGSLRFGTRSLPAGPLSVQPLRRLPARAWQVLYRVLRPFAVGGRSALACRRRGESMQTAAAGSPSVRTRKGRPMQRHGTEVERLAAVVILWSGA